MMNIIGLINLAVLGNVLSVALTADASAPFIKYVAISFVIALIIALIVTFAWKSQLDSVYKNRDAGSYIKQGSFKLTGKRDTFLYKELKKTEKPKEQPQQQPKK